jgi:hypothetical protein
MPSFPTVARQLTPQFHIGGVSIGDARPAHEAQQQRTDPLANLRAPPAFNNVADLINFLRDQSVRDVLHAIGIGDKKDGAETPLDGKFVGSGATVHDTNADWRTLPAVQPKNGAPKGRLLEVNGINTVLDIQRSNIQFLADATGKEVVGVHNASGGLVEDALQFMNDKYVRCDNPAVNTVRAAILDAAKKAEPLDLVCHSQGAIITSRALHEAEYELKRDMKEATYKRVVGDDWERIAKKNFPDNRERRLLKMAKMQLDEQVENMLKNVHVESFGGAARIWPDGPSYVHHVNMRDPVPTLFGLGFVVPPTHPGKGAVVHRFEEFHQTNLHGADGVDASVHGPEQVYFKHTTSHADALARAEHDRAWKVY